MACHDSGGSKSGVELSNHERGPRVVKLEVLINGNTNNYRLGGYDALAVLATKLVGHPWRDIGQSSVRAPDVHIYAGSKLPWLVLGEGAQVFPDYYRAKDVWSRDSLERKAELVAALTGQP